MIVHNCPPGVRLYPLAQIVTGADYVWRLDDHLGKNLLQHIKFCPWCGNELGKSNLLSRNG